jgi:SsrA-binding protein
MKLVAENRKARHNYHLEETFEAGIVLKGTEVKALRDGKANIAESYASVEDGEIWLINAHISEYTPGNRFNHEPRRKRKLLLKRSEMAKMWGAVQKKGKTLVPLKLYFNERGLAKLELALATGKRAPDKRETEKRREWERDKARLLKERG